MSGSGRQGRGARQGAQCMIEGVRMVCQRVPLRAGGGSIELSALDSYVVNDEGDAGGAEAGVAAEELYEDVEVGDAPYSMYDESKGTSDDDDCSD